MEKTVQITGTGYKNQNGSNRSEIIRKHVKDDKSVYLRREPSNEFDENAVAVYIKVPILFGIFGSSLEQIGYLKSGSAKSLAKKIDAGGKIKASVVDCYAPPEKSHPSVTLRLEY